MEEGKGSANKLDMRATKGCSYKQSKKEAIITIIAYIIWGSWGIAIAGLFGLETTYLTCGACRHG